MEVKIGVGLEELIFGMSREEVENILGKPDKINNTEKEHGIVYYYYRELLKAKFDEDEDLRLYSIEIHDPNVFLFKQKIINKTKDEIINLLNKNGYTELEFEDYEIFETIFCEEIWATFEFVLNRLRNVEFSPLFRDDEIIWPKKINKGI